MQTIRRGHMDHEEEVGSDLSQFWKKYKVSKVTYSQAYMYYYGEYYSNALLQYCYGRNTQL
ncbi:hypothetical protein DsansV1_C01g0006711 [Dioscorea sansibarensis]